LNQLKGFIDSTQLVQLTSELRYYLAEEGDSIFLDRVKDLQPDVCLVDFDLDREKASRTAEQLRAVVPEAAVFAISSQTQPDLIIRAMRSGCGEYVIKPLDRDQLIEALARVGGRKKDKREQVTGQILVLVGAKGGTGVTTLAVHLAALLAQRYARKTLLVDLHPDLGDASVFLSLTKHQYNFYDLVENTHRLDADLLQGFLTRHSSGLDLLPAPEALDLPRHTPAEAIERTMDFLRSQYEFVIVDCPPAMTEHNLAVMGRADRISIIATPEIPALRNAARLLEYLARVDFPPEHAWVIINRHARNAPISDAQVEKAIRKAVYRRIPNQYGEVIKSVNLGKPLLLESRSEFLRAINEWAETLAGRALAPQPPKKKEGKGMFGFLGR
jgi:pilus assembly protein CpaE